MYMTVGCWIKLIFNTNMAHYAHARMLYSVFSSSIIILLCKAGVQLEGNYLICKKFVLEQNLAILFFIVKYLGMLYMFCVQVLRCVRHFPVDVMRPILSSVQQQRGRLVITCFTTSTVSLSLLPPDPPSFSMLHTKAGMALLSPRLYLSLLIFACDRSLLADSEVDAGQGLSGGWLVPQPPCLRGQALSEWHSLPEEVPGCSEDKGHVCRALRGSHCQ